MGTWDIIARTEFAARDRIGTLLDSELRSQFTDCWVEEASALRVSYYRALRLHGVEQNEAYNKSENLVASLADSISQDTEAEMVGDWYISIVVVPANNIGLNASYRYVTRNLDEYEAGQRAMEETWGTTEQEYWSGQLIVAGPFDEEPQVDARDFGADDCRVTEADPS